MTENMSGDLTPRVLQGPTGTSPEVTVDPPYTDEPGKLFIIDIGRLPYVEAMDDGTLVLSVEESRKNYGESAGAVDTEAQDVTAPPAGVEAPVLEIRPIDTGA